ncbi:MAG: class I SAM-dependent methyltransferase [Deltaproteobacteria bacterium]|nr:class I SAM-dependent methyltransferase [Deltaproteobacteria bacterium]
MVDKTQFRLVCHQGNLAQETPSFQTQTDKEGDSTVSFIDPSGHKQNLSISRGMQAVGVWFQRPKKIYKDECRLSRINPEEEKELEKIANTKPQLWELIRTRLDDLTRITDSFREAAAHQESFGNLLSDAALNMCRSDDFDTIPQLPREFFIPASSPFSFPTEMRQCIYGNENPNALISEYAIYLDTEKDRRCYWNALTQFVPQSGYAPPENRPAEILDIGCGTATGALPLVEYFGNFTLTSSPEALPRETKARYTGVDLSPEALDEARKINPGEFQFVAVGGLTFFEQDPEMLYDVIVLRHPGPFEIEEDFARLAGMWIKIMEEAFNHLTPNGILIISNYECYEYEIVRYFFEHLPGAKTWVSGINPHSLKQDGSSLKRDYYLTIVGK